MRETMKIGQPNQSEAFPSHGRGRRFNPYSAHHFGNETATKRGAFPCRHPGPGAAWRTARRFSHGMHRALLFAYGMTVEMLVRLIDAGLATATAERMVAGNKTIEVARMRITEA